MRVMYFIDGWGGMNGVDETYRETLSRLDGRIEPLVVRCGRGRGEATVELPGVGRARSRIAPEVDALVPSPRSAVRMLRALHPDLVHVAGPGPLGIVGQLAARRLGIAIFAAYHTDLVAYASLWQPKLLPLTARATSWFYNRAAGLGAPTAHARTRLAELIGARSRDIRIIPQGVDCARFTPNSARRGKQPGVVLTVARLSREKAIERLVAAAVQLQSRRPVQLVIVGGGPLEERLRRRAPSCVRVLGARRGSALVAAYQRADVFCLPSPTETCGQVLLEAGAAGVPSVVVPGGAAAETLGGGGLVAASPEPADIADALERLLTDDALRGDVGEKARRDALRRPWDVTAHALTAAYSGLS